MDVILVLTGNNSCCFEITICFRFMRSRHAILFNDIPRPVLFTFIDICFQTGATLPSLVVFCTELSLTYADNKTFHLVSFDHRKRL